MWFPASVQCAGDLSVSYAYFYEFFLINKGKGDSTGSMVPPYLLSEGSFCFRGGLPTGMGTIFKSV